MSTPLRIAQLVTAFTGAEPVYSAIKNHEEGKSKESSTIDLVKPVASIAISAAALRLLGRSSPLGFATAAGMGLGYSLIKNKMIEQDKPAPPEQQMMDGSVSGLIVAAGLAPLGKMALGPAISAGFVAGTTVPVARELFDRASKSISNKYFGNPTNKA
jgi:hypothetical protein